MTQTLIIHVIRTNKIPFLQSRASWPLTATTLSIMAFGMWLPYSPLASALGFTHLPRMYWPILMLTLLGYVGLTQIIKVSAAAEAMDLSRRFRRRHTDGLTTRVTSVTASKLLGPVIMTVARKRHVGGDI